MTPEQVPQAWVDLAYDAVVDADATWESAGGWGGPDPMRIALAAVMNLIDRPEAQLLTLTPRSTT